MHGAGPSKDSRSTRQTNGQSSRHLRSASDRLTGPSSSAPGPSTTRTTRTPQTSVAPPPRALPLHHIPTDWLQDQNCATSNKLVLCFETELTFLEAREWITDFNQKSRIRLSLHDELSNTLFLVHFDAVDVVATRQHLLSASPLGAAEVYASVNEFTLGLDPCNQTDFKHLVTINILKGSREIFSFIHHVAAPVGTLIKSRLCEEDLSISIVVETVHKILPIQGHFQLPRPGITIIDFDYTGPNLRCCFCFSYRHRPALCKKQRPALFSSIDQESINEFYGLPGAPRSTSHTLTFQSRPGSRQTAGPREGRGTHDYPTTGSNQHGPSGDEKSEDSSASRRRRNRPRHRSSTYSGPSLAPPRHPASTSNAEPSGAVSACDSLITPVRTLAETL